MLAVSVELSQESVVAWTTVVVPIVTAVWALLKLTIGAHLKQQDVQLSRVEIKADAAVTEAQAAATEAALARAELRTHMQQEEMALATPWWRRHRLH